MPCHGRHPVPSWADLILEEFLPCLETFVPSRRSSPVSPLARRTSTWVETSHYCSGGTTWRSRRSGEEYPCSAWISIRFTVSSLPVYVSEDNPLRNCQHERSCACGCADVLWTSLADGQLRSRESAEGTLRTPAPRASIAFFTDLSVSRSLLVLPVTPSWSRARRSVLVVFICWLGDGMELEVTIEKVTNEGQQSVCTLADHSTLTGRQVQPSDGLLTVP